MKVKGPGQSALLLLEVIEVLNNLKVPYVVIGAFALSFHGVVRASVDADALISLNIKSEKIKEIISKIKRKGFAIEFRKGDMDDPIAGVLNITDQYQNRVDLLMGIRRTSETIYERAVSAIFMGKKINIVKLEDFIVLKIIAGGPRDIEDLRSILRFSKKLISKSLLNQLEENLTGEQKKKLKSMLA